MVSDDESVIILDNLVTIFSSDHMASRFMNLNNVSRRGCYMFNHDKFLELPLNSGINY